MGPDVRLVAVDGAESDVMRGSAVEESVEARELAIVDSVVGRLFESLGSDGLSTGI